MLKFFLISLAQLKTGINTWCILTYRGESRCPGLVPRCSHQHHQPQLATILSVLSTIQACQWLLWKSNSDHSYGNKTNHRHIHDSQSSDDWTNLYGCFLRIFLGTIIDSIRQSALIVMECFGVEVGAGIAGQIVMICRIGGRCEDRGVLIFMQRKKTMSLV